MRTLSVLFPEGREEGDDGRGEVAEQPECFSDLNLDQLVASLTTGREEYDLAPLYHRHLEDLDVIAYRQEVFRDLEVKETFDLVAAFAEQLREVRGRHKDMQTLRVRYQRQGALLDVVEGYCQAVRALEAGLRECEPKGRAFSALREQLARYVTSEGFAALVEDTEAIRRRLGEVAYTIRIVGGRVYVARYTGEADYSAEVLATFERFKQGAARDYRVGFPVRAELSHIEERVLELVARLYPEAFAELGAYFERHGDYLDPTLQRFDREVQLYLAYLDHLAPLRGAGLSFCYPEVTRVSKEVFARDTFDLVLAAKLRGEGGSVVPNDLELSGQERVIVLSGPNQGGKTTFARLFGQLHHLACLGCPVPGTSARLWCYDQLFTQFEREEDLSNMAGKLEDDLRHVQGILARATPRSLVVLNEIFASTSLEDSVFLGTKVMEGLVELDVLAVFVTFLDELASFGPTTVSMVSTIVPENPAERTYKVVRRPADGLAYALAIAEKYGLSYDRLKLRLAG